MVVILRGAHVTMSWGGELWGVQSCYTCTAGVDVALHGGVMGPSLPSQGREGHQENPGEGTGASLGGHEHPKGVEMSILSHGRGQEHPLGKQEKPKVDKSITEETRASQGGHGHPGVMGQEQLYVWI